MQRVQRSSKMVKVFIEYCGGWGYYPKFLQMERDLNAVAPGIDVDGNMGRSSSFEVKVDDKFIAWSKLSKRAFPNYRDLAAQVAEYAKTGKVPAEWTTA